MNTIQINTTQNVTISFKLAGLGERILAIIIDIFILLAYMYFMGLLANYWKVNKIEDQWSKIAIYGVLMLPVYFYTLVSELFFAGQTAGKKVMKIRVVKIDGYRASFSDYLVRWLFRIVDIWILFFLPIVGVLSIIISKKNQRIGGISSGTSVISLKNDVTINATLLENIKKDYKPTFPAVINLTDRDAQIIKNLYNAARKQNNRDTFVKLRKKIEEVIHIKKDDVMRDDRFIAIILKDYTYYTQDMI